MKGLSDLKSSWNRISSPASASIDWQGLLARCQYDFPLHHLIEHQALLTPDRTAVVHMGRTLSYLELNARANQLAHTLIGLGVKPDMLVGICIERSIEMMVGLLGILKAGGAYVPFDPDYPQSRLEFMAADSAITVLLTEDRFKHRISSPDIAVISLDNDWSEIELESRENPSVRISADNLAYLIYTSGSTGKPKGAMISHKAIINRLVWMQTEYQLTEKDRVLQKTPMSFDVSVWEFFWPLITGAQLVMAQSGGHRDPAYLADTIIKYGITTLHFVPSMLNLFLSASGFDRVTSVRQVFCSGEALPFELVKRFFGVSSARLHNLYGPTEAAVDVTYWECVKETPKNIVPIGKPISNIQIYILDENLKPVQDGESGELHIGGIGLARGYWNRPELTAEKFIDNPFAEDGKSKLYKTGDLARFMPDGNIEYLDRIDFQVKIRGLRIELGEIEAALLKHPSVLAATVIASDDELGEKRLFAYLVPDKDRAFSISELRAFLGKEIPEYMIPAAFILLEKMPLTPNGKVDRKSLPKGKLKRPVLDQAYIAPQSRMEKVLCGIWEELLNIDRVGINDNFFDLGGNSLLCMMSVVQIEEREGISVPLVKFFQFPTVRSLASDLEQTDDESDDIDRIYTKTAGQIQTVGGSIYRQGGVAIVGMSGRFPGAYDVDELWSNLLNGVESVTFFSKNELGPGLDPAITDDPNYVFARGIIPDGDKFDAAFFGINPTEAKVIDPQQRVFLELAWAALENSGYSVDNFDGLIGVYAGMGNNYYYPLNVMQHKDILRMVGPFSVMIGNEKDHIATRVANKLNLTGPAVSVHTACSTAMTAIDSAFLGLMTHQCDMALAGGISLQTPQYSGQLYEEGGVFSRDGHCRPFDADASGTMFSDSAGIVVLKRLNDAIRDRDTIYAVIKSTAVNNDGSQKISYLAPSISGQKQVIAMAMARAGVTADSISYIEAHGTGTPIGDPIEVEALTQIYRRDSREKQFCGIGSVKSNLGHPTIAAGVTGVIKVALALKYGKIPATLHYEKPNPKIDFEQSPFYVVSKLTDWPRSKIVRRAAVSAFGFGGTNGHAILEEAPVTGESDPSRPKQLIMLSAKTVEALEDMGTRMADFLERNPQTDIADMAYTLHNGRTAFNHRRYVVCGNTLDAVANLRASSPEFGGRGLVETKSPEIVFVFPGQGSQYVNMGLNLYRSEPVFRQVVDQCAEILRHDLQCDLRGILYPQVCDIEKAAEQLRDTRIQQPAIFVVEYALSKLWNSWGIYPDLMVGHSIGEFVCATLSGVFQLKDALHLVAVRARMMSEQSEGGMLSVRQSAAIIESKIPSGLSLAVSNGPMLCVVSGPHALIDDFKNELDNEGIPCSKLHVSRAFHSEMMEPVVKPFCELVGSVGRSAPEIPFVSTMTTRWVTESEITAPEYWGRQLRLPVRFSEVVRKIWEDPSRVLLEVGPRSVATTLARQQITDPKRQTAIASLCNSAEDDQEWKAILNAVGSLWLAGVDIDKSRYWSERKRMRIPLPTYPFARKRYWLDPVHDMCSQRAETPGPKTNMLAETEDTGDYEQQVDVPDYTTKQQLTSILEEISGIEFGNNFDENATFSEMGLDSLFLTQIAFRVKNDFKIDTTFRQLIEDYSSVARLSRYIEEQCSGQDTVIAVESGVTETASAPAEPDDYMVVPTPFQQEILNLIKRDGDEASCSFNESITVTLTGPGFNVAAARQAVNELVRRHEALRFVFDQNGLRMHLMEAVQIEVPLADISQSAGTGSEENIREILRSDFVQPFDLNKGPLFRAAIIKVTDTCHKISLTAHLLVCDGWSLDVLVRDLGIFYSAIAENKTAGLPAAESFREYIAEENQFSRSETYKRTAGFWREKLAVSIPPIEYPVMKNLPVARSYHGSRLDLTIEQVTVSALKEICGRLGCSFYTILLAGLEMLFLGLSGQRKIIIGMPMAGQAVGNRKFLVGNCLNYVPLVSNIDPEVKFEDFMGSLRATILEAIENGRYAFSEIAAHLPEPGEKARVPFIQTCLNMSPKMEGGQLYYGGLGVSYDVNPRYFESFELFINAVTTTNDALEMEFQYNADLFEEEEISRWHSLLKSIYTDIAADSNGKLSMYLEAQGLSHTRKSAVGLTVASDGQTAGTGVGVPGLVPLYFGGGNELFGVCHIPRKQKNNGGVLFCYPVGQEYMKSHWAFRLLANDLLAGGIPVFKFDYFGTGDSLGDTVDWSVDRWVEDIQTAADELKTRAGVNKVSVVALRFGSVLAAMAVEKGLAVNKLILWNPVVSGSTYMSGIKSMHRKSLDAEESYFPYPTDEDLGVDPDEIMGYLYNRRIQNEINNSRLDAFKFKRCDSVHIVSSSDESDHSALLGVLKEVHPSVDYHIIKENVDWYDFEQFQNAILPSETIGKISSLLSEADL